jgi:hypothetical protein
MGVIEVVVVAGLETGILRCIIKFLFSVDQANVGLLG